MGTKTYLQLALGLRADVCEGEGWKGFLNLLVGMRESDLGLSGHCWIASTSTGRSLSPVLP